MKVGDVRVAEDSDFMKLKSLAEEKVEWKTEYSKNGIFVYTKYNDVTDFKMVKVQSTLNISAHAVFDVLMDPHYRKLWDKQMKESYDICCLNPNNDIGYYSLKCPSPIKNRDFVLQRSWLDAGDNIYILNHSVNHEDLPPRKGIVRGISYLTGYWLKVVGKNSCEFSYVTQSDPKGKLPAWVINKGTTVMAPKIIKTITKACKAYDAWKSKNGPHFKPWLYPEQIELPRLVMSHIKPIASQLAMDELVDESEVQECDLSQTDLADLTNGDI